MKTFTADELKELLSGITAGEWERIGLLGNPGDGYRIGVSVAGDGWETTRIPQDHEMMAASPGIARYALELAAALEHVAARLAEHEQFAATVRYHCEHYCKPFYAAYGRHAPECMAPELPALAPQPAPTDGAG